MENAAEGFKIFLGTTIFAMALAVFFSMTSLAKDTADIVFSAIDKTSLMNYKTDITDGENRIVTFQEIIPTIYRYAQEGYGVTIIENGVIIARFDLDTESQVSSCFWTESRYNAASSQTPGQLSESQKKSNEIKCEMAKYLNENILKKVGLPEIATGNENEYNSHGALDSIIKMIYGTGNSEPVYIGWLKANTYNNNYITQRINCDIYGGTTNFSLTNPGVNELNPANTAGTHRSYFNNGLMGRCLGTGYTFIEHIVQIDNNDYIKITDDDGNEENTGLLVYGTLRNTKKREIIYVSGS